MSAPDTVKADEGGVSFWVPGFFGSLAATPMQPGFSFASIYYHTDVKAGAEVAFARQIARERITANFNANLNIDLRAHADLYMAIPSYVFETPFLGGQAMLAMAIPYGRAVASVNATLAASLGPFGFVLSRDRTDEVTGFGDLAPMFAVRWNAGVHNYMAYVSGNATVGAYNPDSLANLGIGHNAIDSGVGYTYFNPQTGYELSAVLGFTYNFENTHTQYQNGVDLHLDMAASHFITKQWQIGVVGYLYHQLTCDSGAGDRVGCFRSQVAGLGPQIGYVFPISEELQGYLNVKAYKEFSAENRPEGWNAWVTLAISPAAPKTESAVKARY